MSAPENITVNNTEFILLSFEGPDRYSLAGGLGVRITNLAQALADAGFPVHLFFIGDPRLPGEEVTKGGKLVFHRWCQWISEHHPNGVYDGEEGKLNDFNDSLPPFVVDKIMKPPLSQDKLVVVLGEEWHTTEAMCRISDLLHREGLRQKVVMFWNANNTFGFHRINWGRLGYVAAITTVSRYMKHIMRGIGLNPLVVPNGIPKSLLSNVDERIVAQLRNTLEADVVLSKVARWDPDKCWHMAVGATARLKARGLRTVLLARGGIEPHGEEVLSNARSMGLTVRDVTSAGNTLDDFLWAVGENKHADILNIRFHCPQDFLRVIYKASDAVLANSGHEPFGLVGLEAMAAGGIAITGGTGEDYAVPFHNAIVLETADPAEIEAHLMYLQEHPWEKEMIREAGRQTARMYTWEEVVKILVRKLEYQARFQGFMSKPATERPSRLHPSDAAYRFGRHEPALAGV